MRLNAFSFPFPAADGLLLDKSKAGSESEPLLQQSRMERQTPTEWADQWLSTPCEWDEAEAGCKTRSAEPKERIGSCDVVGFGCLGRAIGATYGASSG